MLVVTEADRAAWEKYPRVTARPDVVLLHPAQARLNTSRGADPLVVGRPTDPRAAEGRPGPVTHAVRHHARCPAAVVPHVD
jgi:hypothetical protein